MMKIILFLILLFSISAATACSCIQPTPTNEALQNSKSVFVGSVVEIKEGRFSSTADLSKTITFDVSTVYKGDVFQNHKIKTSESSASCGYEFEVGKEYIVYTGYQDGFDTVSLCSRTALLSDSYEDLKELGDGHEPNLIYRYTDENPWYLWIWSWIVNIMF